MRFFMRLKPAAAGIYFAAVIGTVMFVTSPTLRIISLVGGILGGILLRIFRKPLSDFRFYLTVFALVTLSNPLFVHRGSTVLFYLNERAVTLESLLYGANNSLSLISALIWFRIFSEVMTSAKIGSLFGGRCSVLSLLLTLVLRYVPDFKVRYAEIKSAQKTAGFMTGDTFFERVRSHLNVFLSLTESSLELAVRTAMSMNARGGLSQNRTDINGGGFTLADISVTGFSAAEAAVLIAMCVSGKIYCDFYPTFVAENSLAVCVIYAFLCVLPAICEIKERVKWRLSAVKI
jgi:energy-coupling factor transport system permease protein